MTGKRNKGPKDDKLLTKPSPDEATTQSETLSQTDKSVDDKSEGYVFGRPSTYGDHPNLIKDYLTLASQGKSIAQISATLGIWKARFYSWAEQHPDFRDAMAQGKVLEMAFWENEQQANMKNQNYHMNAWFKSARFRFQDDYKEDPQENDILGKTIILGIGTNVQDKP